MTPKEKAEELVRRYYTFGINNTPSSSYSWYECKEFALIAAEEVKEQLIQNLDNDVSSIHAIYWEKVKQEINKL
jgi:hypothetical protein